VIATEKSDSPPSLAISLLPETKRKTQSLLIKLPIRQRLPLVEESFSLRINGSSIPEERHKGDPISPKSPRPCNNPPRGNKMQLTESRREGIGWLVHIGLEGISVRHTSVGIGYDPTKEGRQRRRESSPPRSIRRSPSNGQADKPSSRLLRGVAGEMDVARINVGHGGMYKGHVGNAYAHSTQSPLLTSCTQPNICSPF